MSERAVTSLIISKESAMIPLDVTVQDEIAKSEYEEEKEVMDKKNDSTPEGSIVGAAKLVKYVDKEDGKSEADVSKDGGNNIEETRNAVEGTKCETEANAGDESNKRKAADDDNPDGLSKKALRRQKRWEYQAAMKKRKREHQKEAKRAKAVAEGRDLEAERKDVEERTKSGEGHARREKRLHDRIHSSAESSFKVCLDCSFENILVHKEIISLASQIRYCYSGNKHAPHPVFLSATSLGGETKSILERIDGFPEGWIGRGFDCHTESLEKVHDPAKLVYLTSDSPNVLDDLENDKVYVIGGIVDRNRLKRVTMDRAEELGIVTAKLPITEHLQLFTSKVLTCNHVFEILLKYRDCGKDWKKAMLEVLPKRKDIQGK